MRARHRLSKLLLRQGIVYCGGNAWTDAHDRWLRLQRFDSPATTTAFESDYDTILTVAARRDRLDTTIAELAADSEFTPVVRRPAAARARGDAGNRRLHTRWITFNLRRKRPVIANVAIARELAGWC